MRSITSLFLVLALGVLCVVGCTDEDGVPEYPRCLSDEQCDDGDLCSIDDCTIDGGDGYCEHWDKPCEGNWHEDCSDLEAYYCDPETGVVECTGHTDWFHGQSCCIESEFSCESWDCLPFCCWDRCIRIGWCIDGGCVDGNGYPRDCTGRDAATPCEVGNTIGLCWKGDCAVLDCRGLGSGTLCWFTGYDGPGECQEGDWRCFAAEPTGGGPPGWTCSGEYYGTGDGCDCGCGVIDLDCADGTADSCDYCGQPGSCSLLMCPLGIDPAQNWLCSF